MLSCVEKALRQAGLWRSDARILLALSGGVDSVALLHLLTRLRHDGGFELFAAHLNHGLRQEAARDAAFAAELCRKLGVPCTVGRTLVRDHLSGESEEMAARRLRYGFLRGTAMALGASAIALAHHGDDQAETMLLRLIRGTSLTGLSAMSPWQDGLFRPLLSVTRQQIEDYAREQSFSWVEDATNHDPAMARNRVRQCILPEMKAMNPQAVAALSRTAGLLSRDESFLQSLTEPYYQKLQRLPQGLLWPVEEILLPLATRLAARMLADMGVTVLTESAVETLAALMSAPVGARAEMPFGLLAIREACGLALFRPREKNLAEAILPVPGEIGFDGGLAAARLVKDILPDTSFRQTFSAKAFPKSLVIRTRRVGDWLCPLGASGSMSLKKAMNMRRLPSSQRENWPVFAVGEHILWVPGASLMENAYQRNDNDENFIELIWRKNHEH